MKWFQHASVTGWESAQEILVELSDAQVQGGAWRAGKMSENKHHVVYNFDALSTALMERGRRNTHCMSAMWNWMKNFHMLITQKFKQTDPISLRCVPRKEIR